MVPSNDAPAIFTPDHYEAIGRLVIACSRLDTCLTELISYFGDMHMVTALITVHHQQFSSKIDTLKALIKASYPQVDNARMLALVAEAKDIYDYRSTLVHAAWLIGDEGSPISYRISARGQLRESKTHQPTSKILQHAKRANELADFLSRLAERLLESRNPP